ncbi:hypothetical protein BCF59_0102 [Mycoplasmopsis mustelae]|uniref:Uncharacterized protein n=1 Tax=Mycoplasmopsis mustelae TaxID=171289 RepID=A0A4R7UET7_9BACT|nr:hypothetical protein [Mycoplasmopsis mustelae]TDV24154.1 hypothetical protein BCF59_0102 [Mycoplasmopsis mustelae]
MKNYKTKIIIWAIISVIALVGIIALPIFITRLNYVLDLYEKVEFDREILDAYQFAKAYSIGGLAFFCVLLIIGCTITYAGIKSWRYSEMFS